MSAISEEEEFEFLHRMEQEAQAGIPPPHPDPSTIEVAANAAAKGVAGFGDMFLNAPINAWNISQYITGEAMEAAGHPIWEGMKVVEPPNAIEKGFRAIGAISEAREPQTTGQRILDVATQTGVGMLATPLRAVGAIPKAYEAVKNIIGGAISGTAGQTTEEATGSKAAGIAVSMATPFATRESMISRANKPILASSVRTVTLKDAMDAGYVVSPARIKPSFTTNRVESFAGKAATEQKIAKQNQQVTDRLSAEDIGLPGNTVLDENVLRQVREQEGAIYQEIADLSPRAANALENLKQTRFDAKEQWKFYARSGNPEAGRLARNLSARELRLERVIEQEANTIIKTYRVKPGVQAETVQGVIERPLELPGSTASDIAGLPPGRPPVPGIETREVGFPAVDVAGNASKSKAVGFATPSTEQATYPLGARAGAGQVPPRGQARGWEESQAPTLEFEEVARRTAGRPTLLKELRQARQRIAKTYDIEKALNLGTGEVDAHIIGRLLDEGGIKSKTGNIRIIGKFAQAERHATREGSTVPAPGVSALEPLSMIGLGAAGFGASSYFGGGPEGAALAAVPLLRGPARAALLSKGYQSRLLKAPPALTETLLKSALAGRSVAESER